MSYQEHTLIRMTMMWRLLLGAILLGPTTFAVDLKLTQEKANTETAVKKAYVDYTSHGGLFVRVDKEYNGLRIKEGDAEITLAWTRIDRAVKTSEHAAGHEVWEIKLRDGKTVAKPLVGGNVKGETDLGAIEVYTGSLKSIEVLPADQGGGPPKGKK